MKRIIGVYQSGANEFTDVKGRTVAYDNIELWYVDDESNTILEGKFVGVLPHREKFKRAEIQTLGLPFDDWFELLDAEVEFFYTKNKKDEMKVYGVLVQSISVANKSNPKKEV